MRPHSHDVRTQSGMGDAHLEMSFRDVEDKPFDRSDSDMR